MMDARRIEDRLLGAAADRITVDGKHDGAAWSGVSRFREAWHRRPGLHDDILATAVQARVENAARLAVYGDREVRGL